MGTRDFCTTTKWNAAGRNALGTPIKAYGESVQRDLPPANAKHNAARLPPHLLQQYGKIRHEPENAAIPYGTQRHRCYFEYLYSPRLGGRTGRTAENGGTGTGEKRGCG